jgi:hypothetical protein
MTEREQAVIDGIRDMERDATGVGLCPMAFKTLREEMERVIGERDALMESLKPKKPNPYKGYSGQCPTCGVVFLDSSTRFCGNCGQALDWSDAGKEAEKVQKAWNASDYISDEIRMKVRDYHIGWHEDKECEVVRVVFDKEQHPALLVRVKNAMNVAYSTIDLIDPCTGEVSEYGSAERSREDGLVEWYETKGEMGLSDDEVL